MKHLSSPLIADGWLAVCGLPPNRLAKIDLVFIGQSAGASADGAADQRTFDGSADYQSAERTDSRADSAAADRAVARGVAAGAECAQRDQEDGRQGDPCYDLPPRQVVHPARVERVARSAVPTAAAGVGIQLRRDNRVAATVLGANHMKAEMIKRIRPEGAYMNP